jgi:hypothetical protein
VQYDPFTFQTVLLDGVQRVQGTWDAGDGAGAVPFDCEKLLTPANIAESGTTLNDITTNPIGISARWFSTTPSTYCSNSALDQQTVRNFVGVFNYEPFLIPVIPCNDELSVESPCGGGASQCLNSDFAKTAVSFSAQGAYVRLERALQNQFSFSSNAVRRNEDYIYERNTQFEWQVSGGDTIPFSLCDQPVDPDAGTSDIFADANPSDGGTDAGGPTDSSAFLLGDAVERAIKTITLDRLAPCPACQRRREVLNRFGTRVGRAVLERLGW